MGNVLITGGSGLIGWSIAEALVQQGHSIVIRTARDSVHPAVHVQGWRVRDGRALPRIERRLTAATLHLESITPCTTHPCSKEGTS